MKRLIGMTMLVLVAMALVAPAGCTMPIGSDLTQITPRMQLAGARQTFNAALRILTDLRVMSTFTKDQGQQLDMVAELGKNILDRWQAQIELGRLPDQGLIRAFNTAMIELRTLQLQGERTNSNGIGSNGNSTTRPAATGRRLDDRRSVA